MALYGITIQNIHDNLNYDTIVIRTTVTFLSVKTRFSKHVADKRTPRSDLGDKTHNLGTYRFVAAFKSNTLNGRKITAFRMHSFAVHFIDSDGFNGPIK